MRLTDEQRYLFLKSVDNAIKGIRFGSPARLDFTCPLCGRRAVINTRAPTFVSACCACCGIATARGIIRI